jgi:putative DNA primase/helicase
LTGGEVIAARFMRQDFFEYQPQFKLLIAGNHKPSLRSVDEAIRRRLHLIPFNVTIPPGDRDPQLAEKLKEEWPRILAWMIAGCLEWQRAGLAPPEAVRDATESYFEAQDAVAAWIEDRCVLGASFREPRSALYVSWSDWSQKAGEFTGNQKTFFEKLDGRGFRQVKLRGTRLFEGLKLREEPRREHESVKLKTSGGRWVAFSHITVSRESRDKNNPLVKKQGSPSGRYILLRP